MFRRRKYTPNILGTRDRGGDEVGSLLAETAARIEELIDAADRTASSVRHRADTLSADALENQGGRIVRELSLGLVERVDALAEDASDLKRVLERAARVFGQSEVDGPVAGPPPQVPLVSAPEEPPAQAEFAAPPRIARYPGEPPSQGVVLLATQMAVAGSERDEIATRLRDDFGVTDTEAVLAKALGGAW
jgi:hypothetical protein